ncbi:site-specific integrase [Streptomyces sp. NPDC052236]|uniref:site-specific integrase n=1 Tax=Streptomyces sp. NPDC052236 TaxID=3365686 RepID=UPI0037D28B23
MPFILDADGSYDVHLNRFFRALPTLGCRSANSWEGYARDLALWGRFLGEVRGRSVWDADRADFDAFYAARRLSQPPFRVTAKMSIPSQRGDDLCGQSLGEGGPVLAFIVDRAFEPAHAV